MRRMCWCAVAKMESYNPIRMVSLSQETQNNAADDCSEVKKKDKVRYLVEEFVGVSLVTVFFLVLCGIVHLSTQQLCIGTSTGEFNADRARKHLENITSVGPRPLGSQENEVLTVNFLLEQIEHIKAYCALGPYSVTVDIQKPTGYMFGDRYYDRISNIVVRLEPKDETQHFVLANCHFDTVPNSPGASDNAVGCAVMLEVLHSLANLSTPLKHGVVFVFNGAEENMLQGSHGFITQHPWAKQVRAFINLEAAGVGGKEMMFQAGPNSPWLVQAYVHAAKHPFASVVAQEIFQSGIIPSDTDFRIYRDFGKIAGIDLAFIKNGFIYHTKYDTPDRIPTDSIQRAGDNILAVLKHLMMSEELGNLSKAGQMVFFDLLGMVMVAYPARIGTIVNYVTAVATFLYLFIKCCYTRNNETTLFNAEPPQHSNSARETHLDNAETTLANAERIPASAEPSQTSRIDEGDDVEETSLNCAETLADAETTQSRPDPPQTLCNGQVNCIQRAYCCLVKLVFATLLLIVSWIITGLTVFTIAMLVSWMGQSMFWYSNLYAGISLYGSAATGIMVLIHTGAKNLHYRPFSRLICWSAYPSACQPVFQPFVRRKLGELYFDVSLLVWCFALIVLTALEMCSAYVPMLMVAFPLVTKLLLTREFRLKGLSMKYMVLYLLGLSLPYVYFLYLMWLVFEIFIPIQGRNPNGSPEVFVAALICLSVIFLSSFFIHFIYLARSTKWLLAGLGTVFTVFLLLVSCGLFFPYTAEPSAPRPKRVFVQHITSTIHGLDGQVESKDSGLWINSDDSTGMQHITPVIPEIKNTVKRENCQVRPSCFWPWFVSVRNNWYLPAAEVFPKSPVEFRLLSKEKTVLGTVKMTFEFKGPSHMSLHFQTHRGVIYAAFFEGKTHPLYYSDLTISYSRGFDAPVRNFSVEIQLPRNEDPSGPKEMLSVAIKSYYYSGEDQRSAQLDNMLERFPKWAFVSSWVSIFQMYQY